MQTLHPAPRVFDTGRDTPCALCGAPRLFPVTGLRGEEMAKWRRGEDATQENWLECHTCYGLSERQRAESRERAAAEEREKEARDFTKGT